MIIGTHLGKTPRVEPRLMTRNLSCHTYCIFCGVDAPHNDCAEFEFRGTRSSTVKSVLCMICCKYVSREESETGTCHSRVTSDNTPCVSSRDTTAGVGVTSSTNDMTGYREVGGDMLCEPVSREDRRYRNIMEEYAKIRK